MKNERKPFPVGKPGIGDEALLLHAEVLISVGHHITGDCNKHGGAQALVPHVFQTRRRT